MPSRQQHSRGDGDQRAGVTRQSHRTARSTRLAQHSNRGAVALLLLRVGSAALPLPAGGPLARAALPAGGPLARAALPAGGPLARAASSAGGPLARAALPPGRAACPCCLAPRAGRSPVLPSSAGGRCSWDLRT